MLLSRRRALQGTLAAFAFTQLPARAWAQAANEFPPVIFVHGDGDHAALWMTTLWRMESNGIPRERLFAINFSDPRARSDDAVSQPDRSSTNDQRRELGDAIAALKQRTGAARVPLVGNSRGAYAIRNTIKNADRPHLSPAALP